MGGFSNPIANSIGQLIRKALQSVNFVAGVSGWIIRRDGTAEFNSTTIRGSLIVSDADGSQIHIFDENPGDGAVIDMRPATPATHTITTPVELRTTLSGDRPSFQIEGATIDGVTPGPVIAMNSDELGNQFIGLYAPNIDLVGILFNQSASVAGPGSVNINNADINIVNSIAGQTSTMEIDGGIRAGQRMYVGSAVHNTTLGYEDYTKYDAGPGTTEARSAAGFVDIKDSTGASFTVSYVKAYGSAESDLQITLNVSLFLTVAATRFTFQMRDSSGATQHMVTMLTNTLSDHKVVSVTRRFTGLPANAAGTMTVQWQWVAGGQINRNSDDYANVEVREVGIKS